MEFRKKLYPMIWQLEKRDKQVEYLTYMLESKDEVDYHDLLLRLSNGEKREKINLYEIETLKQLVKYLEEHKPEEIIVFLDWDQTIVESGTNNIIEPEETKTLFNFLKKRKIPFYIITARFWKNILFPETLNKHELEKSIRETMHKPLGKLDIQIEENPDIYHVMDNEDIVGIYYLNILFGAEKGKIIKNFLAAHPEFEKKQVIFVDDHHGYLENVSKHVVSSINIYRKTQDT